MKKITSLSLITLLSCGSYAYAGTMGPVSSPCLSSFLNLEGGYTWNQIKNYRFERTDLGVAFSSHRHVDGFSGRLGGGIMRPITEQIALSSEIGYGYYGRTKLRPVSVAERTNLHVRDNLSGLDALAGIVYTTPNYSVYFKAGALVQTVNRKTHAQFVPILIPTINSMDESTTRTAALPELKVGGAYNYTNNWAITVSYFHAFGANPRTRAIANLRTGVFSFNTNDQNPSIDTVMAGIQYSI